MKVDYKIIDVQTFGDFVHVAIKNPGSTRKWFSSYNNLIPAYVFSPGGTLTLHFFNMRHDHGAVRKVEVDGLSVYDSDHCSF